MNSFSSRSQKKNLWPLIIIILAIPAFLVNLDVEPLCGDEGIRGIVALEMHLKHDLITPTVGGELYFNKPPLYNWILLAFSNLTGTFSPFMLRFSTLVFMLFFSLTIYFTSKKQIGKQAAFYASLMFLTCGRILIYDSMKGLIDTCFSWVIYLMFYSIWYFSDKGRYDKMFAFSYFLAALAFLMKGLPAIVFLGISVVLYLFYQKKIRKLFSLNHLLGIISFVLPVGVYYLFYYYRNPDSIQTLLTTIVNESTKKTVVTEGIGAGFLHILTFPFEFLYYFFPWTILTVYLVNSQSRKAIRNNSFFWFCSLIFIGNIIVYWISPTTFARYLFMFLPLMFIILSYFHVMNQNKDTKLFKIVRVLFLLLIMIVVPAMLLPPFLEQTRAIPFVVLKSIILFLIGSVLIFLYIKKREWQTELFIVFLLLVKMGFNWFFVPPRYYESPGELQKTEYAQIVENTKGHTLYYNSLDIITPVMFQITIEKMDVLKYDRSYKKGEYYIVRDTLNLGNSKFEYISPLHSSHRGPVYGFIKIK